MDTDLANLLLKLFFFAGVIFGGLFLLYLVNLTVSAVGEIIERQIIAHAPPNAARRQLDKRLANGKISLDEYQRLRRDIYRRMREDTQKHERG